MSTHKTPPTQPTEPAAANPAKLRREILIVLTISFGVSGVRAILRLIAALLDPQPLNQQQVVLNQSMSSWWWLDFGLQVASAATLFAYGALALFLLANDGIRPQRLRSKDWLAGAGFAALIGIPGLALYLFSLHMGWTREVVASTFDDWRGIPSLLLWSAANAFGEEVVVVMWLMTRLRSLGWSLPATVAASSVLRGSYHLYQGVSAGFGNLAMGIIFCTYFHKTGRVWPLVIAHFLIDAVAFLGYPLLALLSDAPFSPLS